jgi:hypothetical protein
MNNTSDNGQQNFWVDGDSYESYNTGLGVKQEDFWVNGESFSLLMSDPTDGLFLEFF